MKLWGINFFKGMSGMLEEAWRQVFAHANLPWGDATTEGRSRATAVALAFAFGWLGAHWFYLGHKRRGWIYIATLPLLMAPLYMGFIDAVRFIWIDRSEFESRMVLHQPALGQAAAN